MGPDHWKGLQPEHRRRALLDRAVILLDDVIEVATGSYRHAAPARILFAEQAQAEVRGGIAVEIDLLGPGGSWELDRLPEKFLRRAYGAVLAKKREPLSLFAQCLSSRGESLESKRASRKKHRAALGTQREPLSKREDDVSF